MLHPDYRFCPRCAAEMTVAAIGGRERNACPACGFTHWNNPAPVVAGLVQVGDLVLLARNAAWPPKTFALITGFLEAGETPEQGIAREVKEETSLDVESARLIGVYDFTRKNEVIIAYHVIATGSVHLSEELVEYRMLPPERLKPWRAGTGLAVADWMRARGLPFEFVDLPVRPRADGEGS
ncbi:MAG TPA: NUDIX domain-containing protein [Burkholderiaceae bacterium]|jgi:NADH pyrophosphatase NudC (nudix superfamily)|nr:NUDIX domain-containing protein [Burkholderiaceae bacterium]HRA77865.1 NUDIX domain-containing protein [Burkholderiaceae bacterium]